MSKTQFEQFKQIVNETFQNQSRLINLQSVIDEWKERFLTSPASPKDWYNNAFPGGYLDHILRVYDISLKLHEIYKIQGGNTDSYTKEELVFSALFCQLGKLGDVKNEYFIPNDSDWHVKNMGMVYKFNPEVPTMKIYDRTLYLLQLANIPVTQNEYLAIRNQEGLFDESNKFYFYSGQKETRFRNHLPTLIHQAIQMAQEIEFERWCNIGNKTKKLEKPANATKADKSLRNAKSVSVATNPKFSENTKNLIKDLFTEE